MALNGLYCAEVPLRNYSLTSFWAAFTDYIGSCYYGLRAQVSDSK